MTEMQLRPVYGFGWSEGSASIGTPEPFGVRVEGYEPTDDKKFYAKAVGMITGTSHRYSGKWVLLTIRTLEDPPHYNVRIYESSPAVSGKSQEQSPVPAVATGFAELQRVID
jgi:hypothetical protein